MRTQEFKQLVRELKETKKIDVQSLKDCTVYQLKKVEDIMLDMELSKNLTKTLDIVTDMIMSNTTKVTNKKVEEATPVEDEAPKKTVKKAPKKTVKPSLDEPTGMDFKSIKLGDTIIIFNDSIIDTKTTVVFKSDAIIVAVDLDDNVSYEFKREFIVDGGYKFKGKNYFLRLGNKE